MDAWNWLIERSDYVFMVAGPVVFPAAMLLIFLPLLIAQTPHARSLATPVPAFPLTPGQHFRFMGYAFSNEAWLSGGFYQRTLLLLFRTAYLLGGFAIFLLFTVSVSAQMRAVS
ncbi:MAG: hypothetical protein Q7T19_16570 [Caulobacter sp.]|nr:hypothetical protein [Caulobacter sp.]